jgi:hypothetical protein
MTRLLLMLLAAMSCVQATAETRIDASSEDNFNSSLALMKQELVPKKQAQLDSALTTLPFAGMRSFRDTPPDGIVKLDIKKLDGMTADQIIELARKTVTVKISVGPPPGLPGQFKAPLGRGSCMSSSSAEALPLTGTQWIVTSIINGNVSEDRFKLLPDCKVENGVSTSGRWEQVGEKVRIALNENYAVYLGILDSAASMHGVAANINGSDWSWVAKRSNSP